MIDMFEFEDGRREPVRDGMLLGRDPHCDVVVHAAGVSRHHARVHAKLGVVEIEDLESRNGVLLNGAPVQRRVLRDGDRVQLGRAAFVFHAAEAAPAARPPAPQRVDPVAGEDLLAGADLLDGAPVPEPSRRPPDESSVRASSRPPPAAPPPAAPAPDVLEFADDEVIELRPRAPAESVRPAAGRPAGSPPARDRGVLQFSRRDDRGGLLGEDLAQLGGAPKLAIVAIVVLVAAGLGYLAFTLAS
ncbi:MAG: FHA domain-containing protein [Planctomycetes bacterium]|nr:FHA domain-containing protein [Planctomycetota bacterium]